MDSFSSIILVARVRSTSCEACIMCSTAIAQRATSLASRRRKFAAKDSVYQSVAAAITRAIISRPAFHLWRS